MQFTIGDRNYYFSDVSGHWGTVSLATWKAREFELVDLLAKRMIAESMKLRKNLSNDDT